MAGDGHASLARVMRAMRYPKLAEMPHGDFVLILGLFAWGLAMAWLAFGGTGHSAASLMVASLFFAISFGIPIVLERIADFTGERSRGCRDSKRVEIHTGRLGAVAARIQILLPVMGVAVGFTLIGIVFICI